LYGDGQNIVGDKYYRARGTSMAGPFVAGVAALVYAQHPDWSPAQVKAQIVNTADDIDDINPEHEGSLGSGRVNAHRAVFSPPQPLIVPSDHMQDDSLGNDNGFIEPGETIRLYITLKNKWLGGSNVNVTLISEDPYIRIAPDASTAWYGDIALGASSENTEAFVFSVDKDAPLNHQIGFMLDITTAGGFRQTSHLALTIAAPVPANNPYWMQFSKDMINSGYNSMAYVRPPLEKKWVLSRGSILGGFSPGGSPVIFDDTLYIGSNTKTVPGGYSHLFAINIHTAELKWKFRTVGAYLRGSPAVFKDRDNRTNVVIGDSLNNDGWLYCVIDRGNHARVKWIYDLQDYIATHVAVTDKYVFAVAGYHLLHCIDRKSGRVKWIFDTSEYDWNRQKACKTKPAVDPVNGDIYLASQHLFCIREDGTLKWKTEIGVSWYQNNSSPSLAVEENLIFVGSNSTSNPQVYAINKADGLIVWRFPVGGPVNTSPALVEDVVYVGSDDLYLYALDMLTGDELWKFSTATYGNLYSSPAISADNTVFIGAYFPDFWAVDANTGDLLWSDRPDSGLRATSPVIASGAVYVATGNGYLVKYAPAPSDPPEILPLPDFETEEGQRLLIYVRAIDPEGNPLVYSASLSDGRPVEDIGATYTVRVIGDFDSNGNVDQQDLSVFSNAFGSFKGWKDPYNPYCDFDNDMDVDSADLNLFLINYGSINFSGITAGFFDWIPAEGQGNADYEIIFSVTDNRSNPVEASTTITVVAP
jgi:outer membrane protein assembly factor BamB